MRRNLLLVDGAVGLLVALGLIVLSPGLAIAGLIALLALAACAVSIALPRLVRRRRSRTRGRRVGALEAAPTGGREAQLSGEERRRAEREIQRRRSR